jgi:alcohol dehydrogenase class IV
MSRVNEHISIRIARPVDAASVRELAELDSAVVPADPLLVAEQGDRLRAALSLTDGRVISDPFSATAELVVLLEVHAAHLREAGLAPSRRRSALRAAAGVWRGLASRESEPPAPTPVAKVAEPALSVAGPLLRAQPAPPPPTPPGRRRGWRSSVASAPMAVTSLEPFPFRWQDGERLIVFGRDSLEQAPELLGEDYTLLTTNRALAAAPRLADAAAAVHQVAPGRVDELAAGLRAEVTGELLVALGGGRVIDVAKALAAADPPRRVAAIPTTLSAAEMTSVHRHATGVPFETPRVRPSIVVNDPALVASQPPAELAASALNSLGHAAEAPLTPLAAPVPTLAALEGARMLVGAFSASEPDRDRLALGALLAGYAIGAAWYGLHHVMAQTVVRVADVGHGPANAVLLPHTLPALARRFPEQLERFAEAVGGEPASVTASITARTRAVRLCDLDVPREELEACADSAAQRPELHFTPPPADRSELLAIYEAAW